MLVESTDFGREDGFYYIPPQSVQCKGILIIPNKEAKSEVGAISNAQKAQRF